MPLCVIAIEEYKLSISKLNKIKKELDTLIENYTENDILGPIPNLEIAVEEVEAAIEEYKAYNE